MTWFIGQSILFIAVAFLLGLLVGWLVWGRLLRRQQAPSSGEQVPLAAEPAPEPQAEPEPEPVVEPEPEPEPVVAAEPEPEPEPVVVAAAMRETAVEETASEEAQEQPGTVLVAQAAEPEIEQIADDLQRIEGIGPKMAGALHKAGIRTYVKLAATDEATLRQAIESDGLKFAPSIVTWARQAQLLADGDEAGFADLTRRLVAGRDEGRE